MIVIWELTLDVTSKAQTIKAKINEWDYDISQSPPGSVTNGHRLGRLKNKNLLLTVLKAGTSKIKGLQFKCLMRAFFLVGSQPSSCCILTWYRQKEGEREREIIPLLIRTLIQACLIAQLVKNLPAMQETLVQFPGQKDPLEKG